MKFLRLNVILIYNIKTLTFFWVNCYWIDMVTNFCSAIQNINLNHCLPIRKIICSNIISIFNILLNLYFTWWIFKISQFNLTWSRRLDKQCLIGTLFVSERTAINLIVSGTLIITARKSRQMFFCLNNWNQFRFR